MNRIMTRLVLSLALIASPALAREDCVVPMTEWQPREAVLTRRQLAASYAAFSLGVGGSGIA